MPITLTAGGDSSSDILIDVLKDLKSQHNSSTLLGLPKTIVTNLDQPIASFPAASSPIKLDYQSGDNGWTAGDFTFGLSGGACHTIRVLAPGQQLLTYTDTFPTTVGDDLDGGTNAQSTAAISVPAGQHYVAIELELSLTANASASVQVGSVGIQGTAGASNTISVCFYKSVASATTLRDALKQAFADFVLPLHSETLRTLQPGDYLHHQFNGTMNLGFGATLGFDKVFYSGQYQADIPKAPTAPSVCASFQPEFKAGVSLCASFKYTGSFEALLWKTDSNTGRLHLYKSKTTDFDVSLSGSVKAISGPSVAVSAGSLKGLAEQVLPGGTGKVVGFLLNGKAQNQLNTWTDDVQGKIDGWLSPFQERDAELKLSIERTQSTFQLMDATFNLTESAFTAAWGKVIACDMNAALALPNGGVTLGVGSGLEKFYTRKTAVTFNLFGLFKSEWDAAQIDNYSVIYAGNNTFHLVEIIGERQTSTVNSSAREIDVYFAAQATSGPGGLSLLDADLHFVLKSTGSASFGASIAGFLAKASASPAASQLSAQIAAAAKQKGWTERLELIFKPSAYARLAASTLGKGTIANEALDRANYAAFAAACRQFEANAPANFGVLKAMDMTYDVWRTWNIAANDTWPAPASDVPSRRDSGNANSPTSHAHTYLNAQFNNSPMWSLISFALQSASDFMNLCEDLHALATVLESSATSWKQLRAELQQIVRTDLPIDFLVPIAFALTQLMGGTAPAISGPALNGSAEPSITVKLEYA